MTRVLILCLISLILASCAPTRFGELGDSEVGLASSKVNYRDWKKANGNITKEYYCQGKKPIRKISHKLHFEIPRPPKGITIEAAQIGRKHVIGRVRDNVLWFYSQMTKKPYGESDNYYYDILYIDSEDVFNSDKCPNFKYSPDFSRQSLIYVLNPITQKISVGLDPQCYSRNLNSGGAQSYATKHYRPASRKNINQLMELGPIVSNYTAMIPSHPSIDELSKVAGRIWFNLFRIMTTVKETSLNGDEIVFDLELDLSLFCQYGVQMDDLLVKGN